MRIKEIFVEYQVRPLGLDEKRPRFSWLLEDEKNNTLQTACRIVVLEGQKEVWDSGRLDTVESKGIEYAGPELSPCTAYGVEVTVWDNHGDCVTECTGFETGFLNPSIAAWDGAQWIGAPRYTVCAANRGVFALETKFRLEKGSRRAGIVFGANDFRLLDHTKNELRMEGENYIRYEINLTEEMPKLDIYRVGYAPGDCSEVPFASVDLVNFDGEEKHPLITKENAQQFHVLKVEVDGNNAWTYVDGVLTDAVLVPLPFGGEKKNGRVLNPRGTNDVLTYPRLNEIGFFAGEGDRAYFSYLKVSNLRAPSHTVICETPKGNLYGEKGIFAGKLPVEDECFVVEDQQITADPSNTSIPMLRTRIHVEETKKLKKARLYITARGIYECKVNGQELTDALLAPGLTQYDRRINYQTYDITDKLQSGTNGIGVTLASGWWSEASTFVVKNYNYFGDQESLLAKIVLTYEDGSREVKVSNTKDWKYFGEGPYVFSGYFAGEIFDARKADIYENYAKPDFDDRAWTSPVTVTPEPIDEYRSMPVGFGRSWPAVNQNPEVEIVGEYHAPVYVVDKRQAKTVTELEPGVYIYDMQQEMAGVPRIALHEKAGTVVTVRFAEMLYPDMPEYEGKAGSLMRENYRDATSIDRYICSGKEGEIYQPKFSFHGYRYIEVSGVEHAPALCEVESLQYSSVVDFDGSFESDHALLNRFAENVSWSQKCNFINIPTDCPQRNERMGWEGDTHVFCHTALNNSNLKLFYERNLQATQDLQTEEGQYPEIAPIGGGFGGITYECATIFMNWELYQQYGDLRTVKRFYPAMKKYMDYMKQNSGLPGKGDAAKIGPLGDWLAPEETDLPLMWNAFYYREAAIMEYFAGLLEKEEDAAEFATLAETIKTYWNQTFVDPATGKTRTLEGKACDTECSYVLALEYGVAAEAMRETLAGHLARKARALDHTVGTGFFGTGLLNQALTDYGYVEDAYANLLQTKCPSWLYPVTQGATSIWEHWDSFTKERGFGGQNAMNSFNHYSLGSVLSWMYHVVLGIKRDEQCPGYAHFILEPQVQRTQPKQCEQVQEKIHTETLTWARGSVASPYGVIRAGWEKKADGVRYTFEIPVNTTATLKIDGREPKEYGSGKYEVYLV